MTSSFLLCTACSLKYGMATYDDSTTPEFIFSDVHFDRYEDNQKTLSLSAEKMEQYKDGKSLYAKNLDFQIIDNNGEVTTEGSCKLLAADTKEEKYVLYDDIEINSKKDDMTVTADNLKWNGKSEQLTSGRNDIVSIKKGGTFIQGSGFSASGVSKKFTFTGVITGSTDTEYSNADDRQDENAAADTEETVQQDE